MPRMREEPSRFRVAPHLKLRDGIRTTRVI